MPRIRSATRSVGVRIDASLTDGTPGGLDDPERIQEVLGSLLDNALRCTPAGGTVTIAGRPSPSGDSAVITVTDTGIGLTPAESGQIFRRFAKATDSPGSGLGLTLCQRIAVAHDGTLKIESEPGKGTRVSVTLPLWKKEADA